MRHCIVVTVIVLSLAIGCESPRGGAARGVDVAEERAALMEADRAWSQDYSTSDTPVEVTLSRFLEDVRVLPPDAPMAVGKQESGGVFAALGALPGYSLRWNPSHADVGSAGDLGYTIGTYHLEFQDAEGNLVAQDGKYMTVWKKKSGGDWMVAVDMFNGNGDAGGG